MTVTTRFAPSPTGVLHLGGVRTALYSWAYAKKNNGKFILRIEDTDKVRSTQDSVDVILNGIKWLGLDYNSEPVYQSARTAKYLAAVDKLLQEDKAYKCYCSKERLEKLRTTQQQNGIKPKYDKYCLNNKPNKPNSDYVVRFINNEQASTSFVDLVHGEISVENKELDDLILLRSDGSPTYNLTVVIDDIDLKITHVLRGDDHINNTFRQINIMQALGYTVPQYAHMPMILGKDGKKLSKRNDVVSVLDYQQQGFLKEAMLNYLLRLGWSHGDKEIFSKQEIIELFDIKHIHKSPATFDIDKLLWLNQHYIKTLDLEYIAEQLEYHLKLLNLDINNEVNLKNIVEVQRDRVKTLAEMAKVSSYLFEDNIVIDQNLAKKHITSEIIEPITEFSKKLESLQEWNAENIKKIFKNIIAKYNLKFPKLAQPVRIALTGGTNSPGIDQTLWLLGKKRTIERLAVIKTLKL